MVTQNIDFHPSTTCPTEQALHHFEQKDTVLCDMVEAAMFEIATAETYSETFVVQVSSKMWCLRVQHKGLWAFLFFTNIRNKTIMFLNGYTKRAKTMPPLLQGEIAKAHNLLKELTYA